jgi:alkaline phosphatase D
VRGEAFTLGVASGDPRPDGVTLWTRIAPDPLAVDGLGGMAAYDGRSVQVGWQVAARPDMREVVASGSVRATLAEAYAVHVDVRGLEPDRHYWYRFRVGDQTSRTGRTRTFPAAGAAVTSLRFATASCQNLPAGRFAVYRHLAEQDLDVVLHLGDYIYEGPGPVAPGPGPDRRHLPFVALQSLSDYRIRHAQYRLDPDLQDAHAAHPFVVVPDDHEVVNNQSTATLAQRRANGYQAYWEHLPLPGSARPQGSAMQLFRSIDYGRLAAFDMLDTRQYRSPQIGGGTFRTLPAAAYDPARTLTGADQEQWLFDRLATSQATWNLLAQQVYLAAIDVRPGAQQWFNTDKWDGYPVARERLTRFLADAAPNNPVVLAGDVHAAMVNDVRLTLDPTSPVVTSEFLGSSVTSGKDNNDVFEGAFAENPHMLFYEGRRRGYLVCEVTPTAFRGDQWFVDDVLDAASPVRLGGTYAVEAGRLGAHAV